jgi:hypothetical protein
MIKHANGRYTSAPFYIRSDIFLGDLYPRIIVRYHFITESIINKNQLYIPYNELNLKNGRMRTLQERVEVLEKRACESQTLAETQETQERTQSNHPSK